MTQITQDGRLLQLSTPLGNDYLLANRMVCIEGLNKLFSIELDLLHDETSPGSVPTAIKSDRVLGSVFCLSVHQEGDVDRYFNGICQRFSQGPRNERFSSYRAILVPTVWVLTQNCRSRIFQDKTVPEILEIVLAGFAFDNEIQGKFEQRNYCVQYRESDWDFASRLMEEEGIFYFFEHMQDSHRLVLGNNQQSHRPCRSQTKIPFTNDRSDLGENWTPQIQSWMIDEQICSGVHELRDYNFQLPLNDLRGEHASRFDVGGNRSLEIKDWPGDYANHFDGIDHGGQEAPSRFDLIFEARDRTVKNRQEEIDVAYKTIRGTSDCCSLAGGFHFEFIRHPHREQNGKYVLTSVRHSAIQSPVYVSEQSVENSYEVEFDCIPQGGSFPPYRPPRVTPRPVIHGSQTATVVGNKDDEIFTDKYGRVKVHFHWDSSQHNDQRSSAWLRYGTLFAGNSWGSMFIPRVGHEVIVDFLEGDPNQPIIVGSVYNEKNKPHYELPKYKTLSYIKTRSTPQAKGFNELRFEDKAKKEQVFVHSQKRYDLRARGSMYETCGGNRQEVIGLKNPDNPGGNLAVTIAGCYDLHVNESMYIGIDQKLNEAVSSEVVEDYQSTLFTKVQTKASLNAQEIILEAKSKISLKVGASCIVIDPTSVTIAAAMVKINSGGYGVETGDPVIDDPLDAEVSDNGEPGYLDRPRRGGGSRGRNRRQLRSQHHVYPPRPGESAAFTAMRNNLNNSAEGRHALEVFERNGVQVTNNPGGTVYSNNTVNLDPGRTDSPASGFVHEMGHAEADHDHSSANPATESRADYIDHQLREDANAERRAYEAEQQMNSAGGSERYNSITRTRYQDSYNAERTRLAAAEPGISEEELNRRSHDAAEAAILEDYRNGTTTTGNTTPPQSYVDYWGSDWDRRNSGGGGGGGPAPHPHEH